MKAKPSEEISFGEWLRQRRRMLDLTQQALADQVGCARITLRRIESGALKPSKELVHILLDTLGIPETEHPQWILFARGVSGFPAKPNISFTNKPLTNLSASLTSFIGREKEQAEILTIISKYRLVTLVGSGGVGKTRLSLKVGEQALENYADGVWLIEIAPILDPLLVPRITAIAIGLSDEPQRPVIDMLSDYLREKKMLIILDNCEHLLDACAQLADTLLKSCPNLKFLATSREALGTMGEVAYRVPSLGLPDLQQVLEKFREYESVRLFEARAQLAQVDFSLTIENASSVAKICTRLDGIPLAIELAAARVSMLSTEQIATRLQESFSLLTGGSRTGLPQHHTLRAAIDWSYDLLSPAEQTLFRRFSVFVNGWTLEAAESVASDAKIKSEDILDVLTQLIKKSLVNTEETQSKTRYRMLETMRQYANEKLAKSGEGNLVRDRHLVYFLNLAETAAPHLIRPEQLEWLEQLDADYENLRAALEWSLSKEFAEPSLRLCAALGMFWILHSYYIEGSQWLKSALSKVTHNANMAEKAARVKALYQDASLAQYIDDLERMKISSELSLTLAEESSEKRDVAIARFFVGNNLFRRGDYTKARLLIEQSLAEFREMNDLYWEWQSYDSLGKLLVNLGELKSTEKTLPQLELARKTGERFTLAESLLNYSYLLLDLNQIDEARRYAEEADILCQQIGSSLNSASSLFARIARLNGDYKGARSLLMEMQERFGLLGEKDMRSGVFVDLAQLALEQDDLEQAHMCFTEALTTARGLEDKILIAVCLAGFGNIFYQQGYIENYKQSFRESISLAKELSKYWKIYILVSMLKSIYSQLPESSTRLLGVIHIFHRKDEVPIDSFVKCYYDRAEAHARKALSDAVFDSAFAEGQKMPLDEALDLALKTVEEM